MKQPSIIQVSKFLMSAAAICTLANSQSADAANMVTIHDIASLAASETNQEDASDLRKALRAHGAQIPDSLMQTRQEHLGPSRAAQLRKDSLSVLVLSGEALTYTLLHEDLTQKEEAVEVYRKVIESIDAIDLETSQRSEMLEQFKQNISLAAASPERAEELLQIAEHQYTKEYEQSILDKYTDIDDVAPSM